MSIYKYDSTQDELIPLAGGSTAPSSVFVGTTAEWATETDKTDFNVALITDAGTVNAVDDTTGDTEVVANKNVVFKGTLSEWNNLTTAEKKTYDEALITDDMDTGEVVDAVTNGDMRAVTSNAVYDAISDITRRVYADVHFGGELDRTVTPGVAGLYLIILEANPATTNSSQTLSLYVDGTLIISANNDNSDIATPQYSKVSLTKLVPLNASSTIRFVSTGSTNDGIYNHYGYARISV
jgi:hypothetical protein